jgi:hypothetical protein
MATPKRHRLTIRGRSSSLMGYEVLLDAHPLMVSRLTLSMDVHEVNRVTLELLVGEVDVDLDARLWSPSKAQELLEEGA